MFRQVVLSIAAWLVAVGTVFAQSIDKTPVAVLFIVDCSASTNTADMSGKKKRFEVMRDEVIAVASRLDDWQYAGLLAFGHRAGKDATGKVRYRKDSVLGIIPSEDVQRVVPIRPLGVKVSEHARRFKGVLDSLGPWGESPVYLAMKEGDKAFEKLELPEERKRQIIVLTDGVNSQTDAAGRTSAQQVSELYRSIPNRDVRIDIVGLRLSERSVTDSERPGLLELRQLAEESGGTFVTVTSNDTLRVRLSRILGLKIPDPEVGKDARTGTGTLTGIVRFRDQPVAGVDLLLRSTGTKVRSNAQGRFEFKNVPVRQSVLEVETSIQNRIRSALLEDVFPTPEGEEPEDLLVDLK